MSRQMRSRMALKKWDKEGPSASQFGELLLNFLGMLLVKIVIYILLRGMYRFLRKHLSAFIKTKRKKDGKEEDTAKSCTKGGSKIDGGNELDLDKLKERLRIDGRSELDLDKLKERLRMRRENMTKTNIGGLR